MMDSDYVEDTMYVSLKPLPPVPGIEQSPNALVAVIALPPADASVAEVARYVSDVRLEFAVLEWTEGWYQRADGVRGGWFSNPTLAVQELCHEIVAQLREHARPLRREEVRDDDDT